MARTRGTDRFTAINPCFLKLWGIQLQLSATGNFRVYGVSVTIGWLTLLKNTPNDSLKLIKYWWQKRAPTIENIALSDTPKFTECYTRSQMSFGGLRHRLHAVTLCEDSVFYDFPEWDWGHIQARERNMAWAIWQEPHLCILWWLSAWILHWLSQWWVLIFCTNKSANAKFWWAFCNWQTNEHQPDAH